ncbi:Ribbon-helix-helix protein, CopG family [Actinobaculum sp. oral taxon 183 str. F0552]|nr:Ribbon-helix-helix protein, CopG family [Actinobaculum sp. oral taxon 183 str. F0552]
MVAVRLTSQELAALDACAERQGESRSAVIREALTGIAA